MRKTLPVVILSFFISYACMAQSGFAIKAGTPVFITAGNTVSIDGLVLTPSAGQSIPAPNNLSRNTTITNTGQGAYISRVYKWSNTVSAFSGTIGLYYQDMELNGIAENALTLNVHNGTKWSPFTTGVVRDQAFNVVTTSGISAYGLNELTLAGLLNPLPMQWGPVQAYRKSIQAYVVWNTYDESNTSYFEVERSGSGTDWTAIEGRVPAANIPGMHQYMLIDNAVPAARTFYRIRQVDKDGNFTYSKAVNVNELNSLHMVTVFPNPAQHSIVVQSNDRKIGNIQVYTTDGRLVRTADAGMRTTFELRVAGLPQGNYLLQCALADGTIQTLTFIKN